MRFLEISWLFSLVGMCYWIEMKRSIEGFNQLNTADEVAKAKLKQKHLLNEFLELQKVCTFWIFINKF